MRKILNKVLAVILSVACLAQFSGQAFAASFTGKTYLEDVIIGYGKTAEEAKKWIKSQGYKVLDYDLNEGADDALSSKRAVYLGYKTTMDKEKAITDMKLMNMKGNYSFRDYTMLINEQKDNISYFLNNFVVSIKEYRENYEKGQIRAVAAHDLLNLLYDDDTETNLGDLLLNKAQQEYSADEFAALSNDERSLHADLLTIFLQSNSTSVLAIEQIIALATDSGDSTWIERYSNIQTYDEMIDQLVKKEGLSPSKAAIALSEKYDLDAKAIASKVPDYLDYLKTYTESGITLDASKEEIEVYRTKVGDDTFTAWNTAGAHYTYLENLIDSDDMSLLEIITDKDIDLDGEDRFYLYPMVSVLTEGQRACLDFLPFYQIVALGINDDEAIKTAMDAFNITEENSSISIYDGVDRSMFSGNVAMTTEAEALENSSDKDSMSFLKNGISTSTKLLYLSLGISVCSTIAAFAVSSHFANAYLKNSKKLIDVEIDDIVNTVSRLDGKVNEAVENVAENLSTSFDSQASESSIIIEEAAEQIVNEPEQLLSDEYQNCITACGKSRVMSQVFYGIGIGMATLSIFLFAMSLYSTYEDYLRYYNVDFSAIPSYLVDQGVNENDEKVFTYYKAALCNRQEGQFESDKTTKLAGYGDINGDVGKQWVALYTTKNSAAGQPITADFIVQYANSNIPGESTALSLFGEKVAQNLTNNKSGFTYADKKDGIYLFYGTDNTVYAGSAINGGIYALIGGSTLIIFGIASYFISKMIRTKKNGKENCNA